MKGIQKFLPQSAVEVVVYHSPCNDGHAAAAQFDYYCGSNNITLIGLHPKDDLLTPENIELLKEKHVVFVDICFSTETMAKVSQLVKKAIVLDHHITNQEALPKDFENIQFHFEMGVAGCLLAWKYLIGEEAVPPDAIKYIAMYDVFKHKEDLNAIYFNVAFERPKTWPEWRTYIDNDDDVVAKTIAKGSVIHEYQQFVLKTMAEKAERWQWKEFEIVMLNISYPWISDMGEMLCEANPKNTVAILWNKCASGPFSVSFRSHEKVGPNVATIAQQFGGGGHVHAAAARLPEETPPWKVFSLTSPPAAVSNKVNN